MVHMVASGFLAEHGALRGRDASTLGLGEVAEVDRATLVGSEVSDARVGKRGAKR
jgi:hypothetical protein